MAALQESAATDGYASYGGYDAYSPEAKSTDSVGYAWLLDANLIFYLKNLEVSFTATISQLNICDLGSMDIGQTMSLDAYL